MSSEATAAGRARVLAMVVGGVQTRGLGCEAAVTLFYAALSSPTRATLVAHPYPPVLTNRAGDLDTDLAIDLLDRVPPLAPWHDSLPAELARLPTLTLQILAYVIGEDPSSPCVRLATGSYADVLPPGPAARAPAAPSDLLAVLRVVPESGAQRRGPALPPDSETAYHGSLVENFHGIANRGFDVSLARREAFGLGLYFSMLEAVASSFSPVAGDVVRTRAAARDSGVLARPVQMVAVVAIHPDDPSVRRPPAVPDNLRVVTDPATVSLRHILVYAPERGWGAARAAVGSLSLSNIAYKLFVGLAVAIAVAIVVNYAAGSTQTVKRIRRALRQTFRGARRT